MGITEIGAYFNISREHVYNLIGMPGFPDPLKTLAAGRIWDGAKVKQFTWDRKRGPKFGQKRSRT